MAEQQSFFPLDAETAATVKRYEDFLLGKAGGYFEVDELSNIIDYYLFKGMTKYCDGVLELGNKLHPNSNELKIKSASTCFAKGDIRNALRIIDTMNNDFDYEKIILKIELLQKIGRVKEAQMLAKKLFADATAEDPDNIDLVCLDLANTFISQNNYDIAMKWLLKGEQNNPKNIDILLEKAHAFEQSEDYKKAENIYNQIIDIDAFMPEVWFNLGQLFYFQRDYNKAIEAFNYSIALDENDMAITIMLAHSMFQLERFEEAIELYKTYGEASGDIWQTDIFIAESFEQMDEYEHAIEYFNKSLEKYPDNYVALLGIGSCLLSQEKYAESIVFIDRALDIQEDEPEAWGYLAEALVGMEKIDDALLAYNKSLLLDPNQPDTVFNLACLLFKKGEKKQALEKFLSLCKEDEPFELIEVYIAACYFSLRDINNGIAYLRASMELDRRTIIFFLEIAPEYYKIIHLV
ncbi:MAG: tetratricopeptide repeat protein [Paludibacter sp.]|nr:tetratricopeptide repeat protein [Paludibacter sp.]